MPTFEDLLERLTDLHQDALNAIEGLPPEALDWTPLKETNDDMNSINILITHFCGAERYWVGDIATGDPSNRKRESEFSVAALTADKLTTKIQAATDYAQVALQKLNLADLGVEKTQLRDGQGVTTGWALLHALEHTAIHVGHIQITRQMWAEKTTQETGKTGIRS
jgi:hypothetical protein